MLGARHRVRRHDATALLGWQMPHALDDHPLDAAGVGHQHLRVGGADVCRQCCNALRRRRQHHQIGAGGGADGILADCVQDTGGQSGVCVFRVEAVAGQAHLRVQQAQTSGDRTAYQSQTHHSNLSDPRALGSFGLWAAGLEAGGATATPPTPAAGPR